MTTKAAHVILLCDKDELVRRYTIYIKKEKKPEATGAAIEYNKKDKDSPSYLM